MWVARIQKELQMKTRLFIFLLVPVILLTLCPHSFALVDWDVKKTLKIEKTPVDVAVSLNGRWVFVLTAQGSILIYSGDGRLEDEITVGKHVDGIKVGPEQDILLLFSRKNKTVEILVLDFIQNIDVSNSPSKGPADAAVTIAVFSDFQ
jgi:hypothetical protein